MRNCNIKKKCKLRFQGKCLSGDAHLVQDENCCPYPFRRKFSFRKKS
jgi:hypothetical protein